MALLDEIRKRMQQSKAPNVTGTQEQLSRILQAKKGKAAPVSGGPKASAVGEQAVQGELSQQARQQQMQGAMGAAQLGIQQELQQEQQQLGQEELASQRRMVESGLAQQAELARAGMASQMESARVQRTAQEEMKTNAINSQYNNAIQDMASQRRVQADNIFSTFRQGMEELALRQDAAELEQLSHNMAMSDKQYVDELDAIGKIRGLENDINFKKEMLDLQLGDNTKSLVDELGWRRAFDADEREFQLQVGKMSVDDAIALADAKIRDANTARAVNAAVKVGKSYAMNAEFDNDTSEDMSVRENNPSPSAGGQPMPQGNY